MKFSTEETVSAPIDAVFRELTNFARFEREAMKAGVDLKRTDEFTAPQPGMGWKASFVARGKARELEAELVELSEPDAIGFEGKIGGMIGTFELELVAEGPDATRVAALLEFKARSVTARVVLSSLRLARSNVAKRYRKGVRKLLRRAERRLAKA